MIVPIGHLKRYGKHYGKLSFPCFSVSLFCLLNLFFSLHFSSVKYNRKRG
nr:MAG TPA: hypothetical protein [Caudoviricetes sp.]